MRVAVAGICAVVVVAGVVAGIVVWSDGSSGALKELEEYQGIAIVWADCCQTTQ